MLAIATIQNVPESFEPPVVSRMAAQLPLGQCCTMNDEFGATDSVSPVLVIGALGLLAIFGIGLYVRKRETGEWW